MNMILTPLQAFFAMQALLEAYFKKTSSDSIAVLLSCSEFLEDGTTADTVLWIDWANLVNRQEELTPLQAFVIMNIYLRNYFEGRVTKNVKILLDDIALTPDQKPISQTTWNLWIECIKTVMLSQH